MNSPRYRLRSGLRATSRPATLRRRPAAAAAIPALTWIHDGFRHRVSVWPDVDFEREVAPDEWIADEPGEAALASAALGIGAVQWRAWLEYAPAEVREFLLGFGSGRLAALHVIVRCPELRAELAEAPALAVFLAAHRSLRGGEAAAWAEIAAVFVPLLRVGVYAALFEWVNLTGWTEFWLSPLGWVRSSTQHCASNRIRMVKTGNRYDTVHTNRWVCRLVAFKNCSISLAPLVA